MGLITPVMESDLVADEAGTPLTPDQVEHINALSFLHVWLEVEGIVAVRPWFKRDGKWWPLRFDAAGVGVAPLQADDSMRQGRADGVFAALFLSCPVAIVAEIGTASDVHECRIEPCGERA